MSRLTLTAEPIEIDPDRAVAIDAADGIECSRRSNRHKGVLPVRSRCLMALTGAVVAMACAAATASARPFHVLVPHRFAQPPTTAQCEAPPPAGAGIACYNPAQFQQAYDLNPLYHAGLDGAVDQVRAPLVDALYRGHDEAMASAGGPG